MGEIDLILHDIYHVHVLSRLIFEGYVIFLSWYHYTIKQMRNGCYLSWLNP